MINRSECRFSLVPVFVFFTVFDGIEILRVPQGAGMRTILTAVCWIVVLGVSGRCMAEVGDVTLQTDHPDYPGEGALQTPLDCVRRATESATTDHERALAIFDWLLTHQWHLMSPQEWCQPGRAPGKQNDDYEMVVFDANRGRFSYGYGLCGTVHAWNEVYWNAAGFDARRRAFPGHSNSEVFVNGRWRMYDTDMAGIVFNRDGSVAGYEDIIRDLSLLDRPAGTRPKYPFDWPSDFEVMKAGWQEVAKGGNWYKLYHGGYAAQPAVVHLRSGESLTRFAHPDGFGGPEKRRFWHQQPGGPSRVWTFANNGEPFHDGKESNSRGRTRYGNALFEYSPDLTRASCFEGAVERSRNLVSSESGLRTSDQQTAQVVFEHFSPYVICGDPVDDADPMQGRATDGLVVDGHAAGAITMSVSGDQGHSWSSPATVDGSFRTDLTEFVKGRYGWWLKLELPAASRIDRIRFVTTGQLCETIYPRLKPDGCTVTYACRHRAVVPVLPELTDEAETVSRYEARSLRSSNLEFVGRSTDQRLAYRVAGPKEASVVFRIPVGTPLVGLSAAARFAVRSPTPPGASYRLDYSVDAGATWTEFAAVMPPEDNEFSSGWVYGSTDLPAASAREALVRVRMFGGGYGTGLLTAELYGLRQTQNSADVAVTYGWWEGQQHHEHSFEIPSDADKFSTTIPTGADVRDDFVRISAK